MANKTLFTSAKSKLPRATTSNQAGGLAYDLEPRHALAQLTATGCFNGTFYANAQTQLDDLKGLISQVDDNQFLSKLAIYSREQAFMKDMPAAIVAELSTRDSVLMHQVFDRVIDNGRMLRTLFQMVRSGQFGRTGLSSSLKRAFQRWFNTASTAKLLSASIGSDPSVRDILRMARPKPVDNERRAIFGWLTKKETQKWAPATVNDLPVAIRSLIAFRNSDAPAAQIAAIADQPIRWDLLADQALDSSVWAMIARQMGPQALRMNLNTLLRHGVFESEAMVDFVAERISDPESVKRSRQFPYQFLAAYINAGAEVPYAIKKSLQVAAEVACENVPRLNRPVLIGLDVSGSMASPVTGYRKGRSSKVSCVDAAALFAAAMLRANPESAIVPFDYVAYDAQIDPADTILSIASRLAKFGGGGTDCSIPFKYANEKLRDRRFAGAVLVSDNQSWLSMGRRGSTAVATEWNTFVKRQKHLLKREPRLVCIDIQPGLTTQARESRNTLNIGGFNDAVFKVATPFLNGEERRFVQEVEMIEL